MGAARGVGRHAVLRAGTTATLATALALGVAAGGPAPGAPARAPAAAVLAAADVEGEAASTAADLRARTARFEELQAQAQAQDDALARAQAQLRADAVAAAAALEAYAGAVRAAALARADEASRRRQLLRAQLDLAAQRSALGRWARTLYTDGGGPLTQDPTLLTLLTARSSDDVGATLTVLRRVGRVQGRSVEAFDGARLAQQDAVTRAAAATERAEQATVTASQARTEAARAVAAQRATVDEQARLLELARRSSAAAATDVGAARDAAQAAAQAAAAARDAADAAAAAGPGGLVGPVGDCAGADVSGYPNGELPFEALCPLAGTAGHRLRADAADAYNRLSTRFADVFGTRICITDSYRTYAAQVDLFARKPGLAAVPGTSNHGWGTAVDLCGGIERFGTPEHEWLVQNAPLFGWFHPAWAEPTGSRPEPWHFEYGG